MSAYAYMLDELVKIGFATIPMAEAAQQPGLAHTIDPQAIPAINPPKRGLPHTKLAPRPPTTGAGRAASMLKPPKLPGVFGKAMKGLPKVI